MSFIVASPVWHTGHVAYGFSQKGQATWITRSRNGKRFTDLSANFQGLGPMLDYAYAVAGRLTRDELLTIANRMFATRARSCIEKLHDIEAAWVTSSVGFGFVPWLRQRVGQLVIEERSVHPEWESAALRQEAERWGVHYEPPLWHQAWHEEYREADLIIVPSKFVASTMVQRGVPENRLRIIPYGMETSASAEPRQVRTGRYHVLFVGRVGLQKGVAYLLEAWRLAELPDAELIIVGAMDAGFQRVFGALRSPNVRFLGPQPHASVLQAMRQADVTVLPSVFDAYPLVLLESLSVGTPVITTSTVGSTEYIKQGVTVVPPKSSERLAQALQQLNRIRGAGIDRPVRAATWSDYRDAVQGLNVISRA